VLIDGVPNTVSGFTSNKDLRNVAFCIVDPTEEANYWTQLSGAGEIGWFSTDEDAEGYEDGIIANETEVVIDFTFNIVVGATSSSTDANVLVITGNVEDPSTLSASDKLTLTFTKFEFTKLD
jgi:hypothetical protein